MSQAQLARLSTAHSTKGYSKWTLTMFWRRHVAGQNPAVQSSWGMPECHGTTGDEKNHRKERMSLGEEKKSTREGSSDPYVLYLTKLWKLRCFGATQGLRQWTLLCEWWSWRAKTPKLQPARNNCDICWDQWLDKSLPLWRSVDQSFACILVPHIMNGVDVLRHACL